MSDVVRIHMSQMPVRTIWRQHLLHPVLSNLQLSQGSQNQQRMKDKDKPPMIKANKATMLHRQLQLHPQSQTSARHPSMALNRLCNPAIDTA